MGRQHYVLLAVGPQAVSSQRRRLLPIVFGIVLGYFLGVSITYESESDVENVIRSTYGNDLKNSTDHERNIWLRCVVTVDPRTEKIEKFIEAVKDTYGKRCNQTLYFTSSESLQKQFTDLEFYRIETDLVPYRWSLFHRILEFISQPSINKLPSNAEVWNIVINERTFVIVENLKRFLSLLPPNQAIAVGKVTSIRSYLHYMFPFSETHMFSLDGGIVLSKGAVDRIISHSECRPSYLFRPWYSGRALLQCAEGAGIDVWDPVDEEGYRMFLSESPRDLFEGDNKFRLFDSSAKGLPKLTSCCSDKAISFGLVNYRDQRAMEYFLEHVRVFGVQSV